VRNLEIEVKLHLAISIPAKTKENKKQKNIIEQKHWTG